MANGRSLKKRDRDVLLPFMLSCPRELIRKHPHQKRFLRLLKASAFNSGLNQAVLRLRDAVLRSSLTNGKHGNMLISLSGVEGNEGTSTLAILLALSLGSCSNFRVALIDGRLDGRKFDVLRDAFGLVETRLVFENGHLRVAGYSKLIRPNITFLYPGLEHSMKFFSDRGLPLFLEEARRTFDFTIFDMPPFLKDPSNLYLSRLVDRIYLVAAGDSTRRAALSTCADMAVQAGAEISGVILNKQKVPMWARWFGKDFFFSPQIRLPSTFDLEDLPPFGDPGSESDLEGVDQP